MKPPVPHRICMCPACVHFRAAALELLDACEAAQTYLVGRGDWGDPGLEVVAKKLQAAIAKVERGRP